MQFHLKRKKLSRETKIGLVSSIIFMFLVSLPLLQTVKPIFPEPSLGGVVSRSESIPFTWGNLVSGKFTSSLESVFAEKMGFRNLMIKIENQLNYSIFWDVPAFYGSDIILGKSRILHQREVLRKYIHGYSVDWELLHKQANQLRRIQDNLNSQGVEFVLMIAPTKPHIHPETLPKRSLAYINDDTGSLYRSAVEVLEEYGVSYFDGVKVGLELRQRNPNFPIIAPNASHWSYSFAAYCLEKVLNNCLKSDGSRFLNIAANYKRVDKAFWAETDLKHFGNLTFTHYCDDLILYPEVHIEVGKEFPRIAMIGDSFGGNIKEILVGNFAFGESTVGLDFYYYFNSLTVFPQQNFESWNRDQFDLASDVVGRVDLLLIVTSEAALYQFGFGFLETVFPNEY